MQPSHKRFISDTMRDAAKSKPLKISPAETEHHLILCMQTALICREEEWVRIVDFASSF